MAEEVVSVKATTTDHMGSIGRDEGVAAVAVVTVVEAAPTLTLQCSPSRASDSDLRLPAPRYHRPAMRVFNTLGRRYEEFLPRTEGEVSIYVCGPTVQSEPHVGARAVGGGLRRHPPLPRLARLPGALRPEHHRHRRQDHRRRRRGRGAGCRAGRGQRQALPGGLPGLWGAHPGHRAQGDRAHTRDDRIDRQAHRPGPRLPLVGGCLFLGEDARVLWAALGRNPDELLAGARVEPSELKEDPLDFACGRRPSPGSPHGTRPGDRGGRAGTSSARRWRRATSGDGFDIHGGGTDLIFPHHENEIAQSEGASGNRFARYWLHNGMLNLGGEKMAKSTGLVVDLVSLLDQVDPAALRLLFLRAHYRSQLEYTADLLDDAVASLDRLRRFEERIDIPPGAVPDPDAMARFTAAMDDDFSTPEAVGVLFDLVRLGNRRLDDGEDASPQMAAFLEIGGVLGLLAGPGGAGLDDILPGLAALAERLGVPTGERRCRPRSRRWWRHGSGQGRATTSPRQTPSGTISPGWASCSRTGVRAPAGFGDRVEGLHATTAALAAGRLTRLIAESGRANREPVAGLIAQAHRAGVTVDMVDDVRPEAGTEAPQGVVGVGAPIPTARSTTW